MREINYIHDIFMSAFPEMIFVLDHRVAISFHVTKIQLTENHSCTWNGREMYGKPMESGHPDSLVTQLLGKLKSNTVAHMRHLIVRLIKE